MLARHPYRALGAVAALLLVSIFLSAMIGQFNDGPWGGLPAWLGAASWFTFLATSVALLVLATFLVARSLRHRKAVR